MLLFGANTQYYINNTQFLPPYFLTSPGDNII